MLASCEIYLGSVRAWDRSWKVCVTPNAWELATLESRLISRYIKAVLFYMAQVASWGMPCWDTTSLISVVSIKGWFWMHLYTGINWQHLHFVWWYIHTTRCQYKERTTGANKNLNKNKAKTHLMHIVSP